MNQNFVFFSHAEWKTLALALQLVSLPPFQFAFISWMKRPVFDVFDSSFVPDCFLLQFSLFLCCSIRRHPADFLERPPKRSGCTVTNSRATSSRAGFPRRKTPTSPSPAAREVGSLSLSLQVEEQLLPFGSHVQTSDFRLQRHIFKQDCRKSKPILVELRSCR